MHELAAVDVAGGEPLVDRVCWFLLLHIGDELIAFDLPELRGDSRWHWCRPASGCVPWLASGWCSTGRRRGRRWRGSWSNKIELTSFTMKVPAQHASSAPGAPGDGGEHADHRAGRHRVEARDVARPAAVAALAAQVGTARPARRTCGRSVRVGPSLIAGAVAAMDGRSSRSLRTRHQNWPCREREWAVDCRQHRARTAAIARADAGGVRAEADAAKAACVTGGS